MILRRAWGLIRESKSIIYDLGNALPWYGIKSGGFEVGFLKSEYRGRIFDL